MGGGSSLKSQLSCFSIKGKSKILFYSLIGKTIKVLKKQNTKIVVPYMFF